MARPHIVIVGAGFGGLSAAHTLAGADADVTVIDRRNYHLFQPLLYQVATAGLSPAQIASPIRAILRRRPMCACFWVGSSASTRSGGRSCSRTARSPTTISCWRPARGTPISAMTTGEGGARPQEDRRRYRDRRRILVAFENAESDRQPRSPPPFPHLRGDRRCPTGVEMAGAIAELAPRCIAHDFRNIDPREARIVLVEAGPRVLPAFPPS